MSKGCIYKAAYVLACPATMSVLGWQAFNGEEENGHNTMPAH